MDRTGVNADCIAINKKKEKKLLAWPHSKQPGVN